MNKADKIYLTIVFFVLGIPGLLMVVWIIGKILYNN